MSVGKYYRQNISVGNSVGFLRFSGSAIIIIIKLINLKKNIIIIEQKQQVLFEGIKNYKNLG